MGGNTAAVVVEVQGLKKNYGKFQALRDISFSVRQGEVYGLIGPNGAGKTTTLRVLATRLRISGGSVRIFGVDVDKRPEEVRRVISYLPEDAAGGHKEEGLVPFHTVVPLNTTGARLGSGKSSPERVEFEKDWPSAVWRQSRTRITGRRMEDPKKPYRQRGLSVMMATMGPRPDDTVDFARAGAPEEREPQPWEREEGAAPARTKSDQDPGSLAILIVLLTILAIVAVVAYLLGWVRI